MPPKERCGRFEPRPGYTSNKGAAPSRAARRATIVSQIHGFNKLFAAAA